MIASIVKSEKAKVDRLKELGLKKYVLVTNVKGSSHPGTGSIDRVNEVLSTELGVESYCWWRDDLDRRLEVQSSVRWSYPEILKATDLLELLVHGTLGEDEERRRSAIRAYMTSQYEDDQELKFKQTDLRSTMTELFVDLPMCRSVGPLENESGLQRRMEAGRSIYIANGFYLNDPENSAEFFLKTGDGPPSDRLILEGAPGQGKSTVTQYVCQVFRMHLLGKAHELSTLPDKYKNVTIRIPMRVDLRDLAKWISGIDPFQSKQISLDEKEPKSLEGFLCGQIRNSSGGHNFNVSDLTAVAKVSHLFIALDGFDEVADIDLRQRLVTEITKGSTRLINSGGYSVKVVVTSRPAAFAKSVRFPRENWQYYELLPLERSQVDSYTSKWMTAKGLKSAEKNQLSNILDVKLREAHTQFLAKNPMQLTILLSLIHSRGPSLPEKRTAMYDAYMDMFFSRESEKSDVVRENRDLLIDIHRFLAWKLQTAAEAGENGSIEHGVLRSTLLVYLDSQGENTSIVNDLFNGVIERVGDLVSRVQETYEFEVQPLREYFAARHLYETAPYSPTGDEKTGTKLDRFDALIRNPYWLNVARFYGGCFSKGEISALVDELALIAQAEPYSATSHPRSVATMLLGDWVFTQYQPAVKRIINFICDHPQFRQLLAGEQNDTFTWPTLPDRSGRIEFLDLLWGRISDAVHADERQALAVAISQNSSAKERSTRWSVAPENMSHWEWVWFGNLIGVFGGDELEEISGLCSPVSVDIACMLLASDRFDFLEGDASRLAVAKHALLNDQRASRFPHKVAEPDPGILSWMATVFSRYQYGLALSDGSGATVRQVLERRFGIERASRRKSRLSDRELGGLSGAERDAVDAYISFMALPTSITSTSIEVWANLVERLRSAWGDCPAIDRIAFIGAGVRAKGVAGEDVNLLGASDLVAASRFARLKSGAPRWWESRLAGAPSIKEGARLLLLLWLWGTPRTLLLLSKVLDSVLKGLSAEEWSGLHKEYAGIVVFMGQRELIVINRDEQSAIDSLGSRASMLIGTRLAMTHRRSVAIAIADDASAGSPERQFAMEALLAHCRDNGEWDKLLPKIETLYARGASARPTSKSEEKSMTLPAAEAIANAPHKFPLPVVALADGYLRAAAGAKATKLMDVAVRENWFL